MMCPQNVLFGYLPEAVTVSGRDYPVNTGFRTWLWAGEIMKSDEAIQRKLPKLFGLCYKNERPDNDGLALSGIMNFYKNAFPRYKSNGGTLFSADFDGQVLYSGFMKCFGVDLSETDIHWYRFAPLLYELSDCAFSAVVSVRMADSVPKGQERLYAKLKSAFAIPGNDSAFASALAGIF